MKNYVTFFRFTYLRRALRAFRMLFAVAIAFSSLPFERVLAQSEANEEEKILMLDPFEITESSNVGYGAKFAMSSSRLNLRYIDVPQTVNVVTSEFLEDAHIFDSREFVKYVGNVNARTNAHQVDRFYIRGLQTSVSYVDGYRATHVVHRDSALYDRIEYVKGPASAAIGRGEAGGLVNYISKAPIGVKKTKVRITGGTESFYRGEIDHNGIISSNGDLNYRLSGYYENSEAIRGGALMPFEKYGIGPSLKWKISEKTRLEVNSAFFHHRNPGNVASAHWMHEDIWPIYEELGIVNRDIWNPRDFSVLPRKRVFGFLESWRDVDVVEADIIFTHRFNDVVSIRQGVRLDNFSEEFRRYSTPPRISVDPDDASRRRVSITYRREFHEREGVRAQGDLVFDFDVAKSNQQILVGYEVFDQSGSDRIGQRGGLFQDMYDPSYDFPAGFDPETYIETFTTDRSTRGDGLGYYGQYSGSFFDDRINVIYGWRKDRTSSSTHNNRNDTDTDTGDLTTDVPRYSVSFKPVPWASIYYLHSEQADPTRTISKHGNWQAIGGATVPPPSDPRYDLLITSAITATLEEYGVKADFLDGNLTLSIAYFDMIRSGFIQNETTVETGANGIGIVQFNTNFVADGELIDGIEIEVFGRPADRLTFFAGLALPNGTKPRSDGSPGGIEALGDTFTLHGKYSFRNSEGNGFEVMAGGKIWFGGWNMNERADFPFSEDQHNIDLGGSYYWKGGKFGLHLKVKNVTDQFVLLTPNSQWGLRRAFFSFTAEF